MDRDRSNFGELLRRYRASAGLTQQALAERANISLRGLSDLERGVRRAPRADTVYRLADALQLGPSDRSSLLSTGRRGRRGTAWPGLTNGYWVESKTVGLDFSSRRPPNTEGGFPFVGRQAELVTLGGHLETATRGQGGVILISGEPGIGKTRLALEAASRAQSQGWQVLYGSARAVEAAPS